MDRELFNKCMDVLRSGEYRQCRNWLHTPDGYCYQGVCMDVIFPGLGWELESVSNGQIDPHYVAEDGAEVMMRHSVAHKIGLGIPTKVTRIGHDGELYTNMIPLYEYLAELDDGGFSLKFIAAVAESFVGE